MTAREDRSEPRLTRSPEQLLAHVYKRGRVLRMRRLVVRALSIYGVAAVVVIATVVSAGSPGSDRPFASSSEGPPTTEASPPGAPSPTPAGEPSPINEVSPSASESSGPVCRNSHNPACGDFYFDPKPEQNHPLRVSITHSPNRPKTGEAVTFLVVAEDPDARVVRDPTWKGFGDGPSSSYSEDHVCGGGGFGAWTPPEPQPDRHETTFTHVYQSQGTYAVKFGFHSHTFMSGDSVACPDPYGSEGAASVRITVEEA